MNAKKNKFFKQFTRSYYRSHPDQRTRIKEQHLKRLALGKEGWNKWANLFKQYIKDNEIKDALLNISGIEITHGDFNGYQFPCDVDFSKTKFTDEADFRDVIFSGVATFRDSAFSKAVFFRNALFSGDAVFSSVKFSGDTYFSNASFSGSVFFSNAVFAGNAAFIEAIFSGGDADFREAMFRNVAFFSSATFSSIADFSDVVFSDAAFFSNSVFSGSAFFSKVAFSGDAVFIEASFYDDADFRRVVFYSVAYFNSTKFKILILEKTKFLQSAPDFRYSVMDSLPYLSNMTLSKKIDHKANDDLRYRKLKEMAISSHDHQKELEFFACEMRADRIEKSSSFSFSDEDALNEGLKIWLNKFFDVSSEYGQSIIRPFFMLIFVFSTSYFINNSIIEPNKPQCSPTFTSEYAIVLFTASNSLPILPSTLGERREITECLFTNNTPPPMVKFVGVFQFLFSAISLLLIGLGVRNRFKIS